MQSRITKFWKPNQKNIKVSRLLLQKGNLEKEETRLKRITYIELVVVALLTIQNCARNQRVKLQQNYISIDRYSYCSYIEYILVFL